MPLYRGIDGVNRNVTSVYRGINGINKKVSKSIITNNGVSKNIMYYTPKVPIALVENKVYASYNQLGKYDMYSTANSPLNSSGVIKLGSVAGRYGSNGIYFTKKVNVDGYYKMIANFNNAQLKEGNLKIGFISILTGYVENAIVKEVSNGERYGTLYERPTTGQIILDISDISGSYYPYIVVIGSSGDEYIYIDSIKLV